MPPGVTSLIEGIAWSKDSCFVCGASATLAELRDNNLTKHLRCSQCGADWRFRRLQCVHCGNKEHRTLRFLYAKGQQETGRVEVCDSCRGYIKIIMSFGPTPPEMLVVEDLAILYLDYIGQKHGVFRRDVLKSS